MSCRTVCVAAVALEDGVVDAQDSKVLTHSKRQKLALQIRQSARLVGIGWASSAYIDAYGITAALKQAALSA